MPNTLIETTTADGQKIITQHIVFDLEQTKEIGLAFLGCGGTGGDEQQMVADGLARSQANIHACILTGDNFYKGGVFGLDVNTRKAQFEQLVAHPYKGFVSPIYAVIGNHEAGLYSKTIHNHLPQFGEQENKKALEFAQACSATFESSTEASDHYSTSTAGYQPAKKYHQPAPSYQINFTTNHGVKVEIFCIDSNQFFRDPVQQNALKAWLARPRVPGTHRVIATHHNLYTPGERALKDELKIYDAKEFKDSSQHNVHQLLRKTFSDIVKEIGGEEAKLSHYADVVVGAHDHYQYLSEYDGVPYVGTGAGGSTQSNSKFGFVEPGLKYLSTGFGHTEIIFDKDNFKVTMYQHSKKNKTDAVYSEKKFVWTKLAAQAAAAAIEDDDEYLDPVSQPFRISTELLIKTHTLEMFKQLCLNFFAKDEKIIQEFISRAEVEIRKIKNPSPRLQSALRSLLAGLAGKEKYFSKSLLQEVRNALLIFFDEINPNPKDKKQLALFNQLGAFTQACHLFASYKPHYLKRVFQYTEPTTKNLEGALHFQKEIQIPIRDQSPEERKQEYLHWLEQQVESDKARVSQRLGQLLATKDAIQKKIIPSLDTEDHPEAQTTGKKTRPHRSHKTHHHSHHHRRTTSNATTTLFAKHKKKNLQEEWKEAEDDLLSIQVKQLQYFIDHLQMNIEPALNEHLAIFKPLTPEPADAEPPVKDDIDPFREDISNSTQRHSTIVTSHFTAVLQEVEFVPPPRDTGATLDCLIAKAEEAVLASSDLRQQADSLAKQAKESDRLMAVKEIIRDAIQRYLAIHSTELDFTQKFSFLELWDLCLLESLETDEHLLQLALSLKNDVFQQFLYARKNVWVDQGRLAEELLKLFGLWDDKVSFDTLHHRLGFANEKLLRNFFVEQDYFSQKNIRLREAACEERQLAELATFNIVNDSNYKIDRIASGKTVETEIEEIAAQHAEGTAEAEFLIAPPHVQRRCVLL